MFKTSDFFYKLPEDLIAQYPLQNRDDSRLMVIYRNEGKWEHSLIKNLPDYLNKNDGVVINISRVIPARLFCRKSTGGKVEILLTKKIEGNIWSCLVKNRSKIKNGIKLFLENYELVIYLNEKQNDIKVEFLTDDPVEKIINKYGHIPLPPYIKRSDESIDRSRYQTIYAKVNGSVAAPTAGLHLSNEIINKIKKTKIKIIEILLHTGTGTFILVKVEDLSRHNIESEYFEINENNARDINFIKQNNGKILAVGTTSVRALESSAECLNKIKPYSGYTDLFIYPPYEFKIVDMLLTNFHLPKSSLLMLVCAFAGYDLVMSAYNEAIKERYRFYSYGDAMLII